MELKPTLEETVAPIEDKLGIPRGFFLALEHDDDWSFLIKLAVICEGAVARAIEKSVGKPELAQFISQLNTDGRTGRVALALTLGVIEDEHARFVRALAFLRNLAAHRLAHVSGFDLKVHLTKLNKQDLRAFARDAVCGAKDEPVPDVRLDTIVQRPKTFLLLGALMLLQHTDLHEKQVEIARMREKLGHAAFPGLRGLFDVGLMAPVGPGLLGGNIPKPGD